MTGDMRKVAVTRAAASTMNVRAPLEQRNIRQVPGFWLVIQQKVVKYLAYPLLDFQSWEKAECYDLPQKF